MKIDQNVIDSLKSIENSELLIRLIQEHAKGDPDTLFKLIEELGHKLQTVKESLNTDGLEKLVGETPKKGVHYQTKEEVQALQTFIEDNVAVLGEELADQLSTLASNTQSQVQLAIQSIPKPKNGNKGGKGDEGKPGDDGSPDTPEQVMDKAKSIKGAKRFGFANIKGLVALAKRVRDNSDDIASLKLNIKKEVTAYIQNGDSNNVGGGISNIVEDVTPQLGGDLDTNEHNINLSDGKQYRVKGSDANHVLEYDAIADGPSLKGWEGGSLKKVNGGEADVLKWDSDGVEITGNVQVSGNVDGRDVSVDGSKLDTVETNAQANLTTEQLQDLIAAMFQGGTHTNASINYNDASGTIDITASGGVGGSQLTQEEVEDFVGGLTTQGTGISVNYDDAGNILTISLTGESFTTALKNKLDNIEANATADQTGSEIKTAYENEADTNAFTDAEKTKLGSVGVPRVGTITSSATPTPNADDHDVFNVTALAVNATLGAPTGTSQDGQRILIRIKDNGTSRTLAYSSTYRAISVTLPTTTTSSKVIYLLIVWHAGDGKWDVLAAGEEA